MAFCEREVPRWNTISISGYHIREAGSTAVQEVAFTLANAVAYVDAATNAGLDVESVGSRLSFFFNAHNDFLEEIAKFRAARRLWARLMRDRFGATTSRAQQLRFHAQTAGSTLTAQQPDNNIVRVALQAMAAVLGGAQSLHCNASDEALGLPTEESATRALRTQQIILHESGVANTVDPVGGAFAVEQRTERIEREAAALIGRIDEMGGTLAAIDAGFMQREIQESAYVAQQAIDAREPLSSASTDHGDCASRSTAPMFRARSRDRACAGGPRARAAREPQRIRVASRTGRGRARGPGQRQPRAADPRCGREEEPRSERFQTRCVGSLASPPDGSGFGLQASGFSLQALTFDL